MKNQHGKDNKISIKSLIFGFWYLTYTPYVYEKSYI